MEIFLTVLFSVIGTIVIVCLLSVTIPDLKLMFSRKARAEEKTMKIRVAELEAKVETLEQQLAALQQKETHIVFSDKDTSGKQLLNVSNLKVNASSITHISSQTFEQSGSGDSRIKIIHYADQHKTDSVYSSFDSILEQLAGNFLQINKNQIINLDYIHKVQGEEIYLKNVSKPFYVSEGRKPELDARIVKK
ncbi:MAG: LytTR family transcriptional regulator DNA-binding domain-containing protein [Bacteroidales bacterium]|nr:LytTR family transcriptional regulator DNA-binding domain-containing protein [Bacteroidales bacterium]